MAETQSSPPRERGQSKEQENKRGTWRGTLIHALEKRLRERERENRFVRARPPNILKIALCGLASSCFHPCPLYLCLRGRTFTPCIHVPCVYMQRQKRQASKQEKETR